MAPPHDLRRPFKRVAISDQQRRRELALLRQLQHRSDAHNRARCLASSVLDLPSQPLFQSETLIEPQADSEFEAEAAAPPAVEEEERDLNVVEASRLKGSEARRWFARQLMFPEWMIDVPPLLDRDWFVFPRPAGKRCFVVSCNGTTPDQTYYVIDMVCWRGYSLYDCSAEFRFFWLNSKLEETGACNPPSAYHKYRFSVVPIYECNEMGLHTAYTGIVPYAKDGLLFYNKHAHYQTGITPLALVWKDEFCSQYLIDTDSKGQVPAQQQVVLELQDDGKLTTSDDPPFVFGCVDEETRQKLGLWPGNLVKFVIRDESVRVVDGKLEIGDIQFIGKSNRARAFADSYSKVFFQYTARHSPLQYGDLIASIQSNLNVDNETADVDMAG